ncbi:unnamed protein product [Effrenium voratum]|nr:unnamed protein product [Effrenium voratum]
MFRRRDDAKPEVLVESNGASLPLAPQAQLGTCVVDRHRVLQVCLGRDHGVLLSDAGVAFTWGDNRYGQLGRTPVLKEEFGRPFPVLGLSGYEVTQVSAGHHHCLALVAPGLVWAWGRNKQGQLGIGDFRDQTQPVKVCHPPIAEGMDSLQLGANKGGAIVTVNAGCDSSLAAAGNADVWQWGEISDGFAVPVNNPDKSKKSGLSVVKSRPYCVFDKAAFRSQMRSGRISVSSTGCKVLHQDTFTDKVRAETLVQGVQDFQSSINQDRKALMELEKELEVKKAFDEPRTSLASRLHFAMAWSGAALLSAELKVALEDATVLVLLVLEVLAVLAWWRAVRGSKSTRQDGQALPEAPAAVVALPETDEAPVCRSMSEPTAAAEQAPGPISRSVSDSLASSAQAVSGELDTLARRLERCLMKVQLAQGRAPRLRAELELLTLLGAARDLLERSLRQPRSVLAQVFGTCDRVARLRAVLDALRLSEGRRRDRRLVTCRTACDAVEGVLRDGLQEKSCLPSVFREEKSWRAM